MLIVCSGPMARTVLVAPSPDMEMCARYKQEKENDTKNTIEMV